MKEIEVKFERENLSGIVAIGSYLSDVAKRFGIHFEEPCVMATKTHGCSVVVASGSELLSKETRAESEYFESEGRKPNERLACQAKIEKPGEIVIMTKEKVEHPEAEQSAEDKNEQYRKEFTEMPLEKKIASLVHLETIALGETVSFIMNSPFKIADKVVEVMAEFGFKKEEQQKKAVRPEEHKAEASEPASNGQSKSDKAKS